MYLGSGTLYFHSVSPAPPRRIIGTGELSGQRHRLMLVVTRDEILVVICDGLISIPCRHFMLAIEMIKLRSDKPSAIVGRQPFLSIDQVTETQLPVTYSNYN